MSVWLYELIKHSKFRCPSCSRIVRVLCVGLRHLGIVDREFFSLSNGADGRERTALRVVMYVGMCRVVEGGGKVELLGGLQMGPIGLGLAGTAVVAQTSAGSQTQSFVLYHRSSRALGRARVGNASQDTGAT